ncbi:hypothetical protein [Photobacterium aquimaris]|uniref:Uncharacterized protein n=1 Tax=Photobacterium aquimaris TaxID=512643 RepID=A0A2T3HTZ9_9GAMM|nr:hypothetical protein [Photobacterium aquimaris]OBU21956.1 hypothetical protein AYY21_15680 [Photobacterium aquimaris]PQJ40904.1 hypothetical protein BTN98_04375 [Photobacterium aquimaris]PST98961.1 hypothetical protein C0W81_17545 [Photobacterium aquimaris]
MINVNFELAKQAYAKVLMYPHDGEIEQHEYMALRVFRWDLARAGKPIDTAFDLRLQASGYRKIASQPAKAHRSLPACVLAQMSDGWKSQHGYL